MNRILQILAGSVFALMFSINSYGQLDPPTGLCADVLDNGDVEISWVPASSMNPLWNFELFKFNGGFSLYQTLGAGTSIYPDAGANAHLGSVQYYIQVTDGATTSDPTPTISTIYLDLDVEELGSVAALEWNPPFTEMPVSGEYKIQRNIDGAGYEVISVLPFDANAYQDTLFALCVDTINPNPYPVKYKVTYLDGGCTMNSQVEEGLFQDQLAPTPPSVETISTDPFTGDVTIYWYPSDAPDGKHYIVQEVFSAQEAYDVDTILWGESFLESTYLLAPDDRSVDLAVLAYDSCENVLSYEAVYSTMYVQSSYEDCGSTMQVWWNPYLGWEDGLEKNQIHVYKDGVFFEVIDLDPNAASHELDVDPGSTYKVYIEAWPYDPDGFGIRHSTSNMTDELAIDYPIPPAFNYINRVTTISPHHIQIDLRLDLNTERASYELFRSRDGSSFRSIGTYESGLGDVLTVDDFDVNADVSIYTYKWKIYDGCGQEVLYEEPDYTPPNKAENMVVEGGKRSDGFINYIEWNPYIEWNGGVQEYQIFRKLGIEGEFEYHDTVMPDGDSDLYYEEDVEQYMLEEGLFCYKVLAIQNDDGSGKVAESYSNETCVTQDPIMWIPNTIVINGHNDEFFPVAGFINFSTYEMEIRNKGGEQLFYSDDIEFGWTGTYQGRPVREDYYMYTIVYRDGAGQHYVKRGPLYVLRAKKQ